jgi:hypothetical protein
MALALASFPGESRAVPLTAASHLELEVIPGDGLIEILGTGEATFRLPGEHTTPGSTSVWRGLATAETGLTETLTGRPFASVRAESSSQLATNEAGNLVNAPGESFASAVLTYQVLMTQIVPPPVPLLFIPATVTARASAFTSTLGDPASNGAHAGAGVLVAHFGLVDIFVFDGDELTEEQSADFLFIPGALVDVRVAAVARSHSGGNQGGPLSTGAVATAFADPVFTFNQEAFDETARQQGFAPFDLSLYFAFEQPGPSASPVPAPAPVLLVLAGAAWLGTRAAGRRLRGGAARTRAVPRPEEPARMSQRRDPPRQRCQRAKAGKGRLAAASAPSSTG